MTQSHQYDDDDDDRGEADEEVAYPRYSTDDPATLLLVGLMFDVVGTSKVKDVGHASVGDGSLL